MGYYRHPNTQQERRRWFADEELLRDYPNLRLRRKRSAQQLPTNYDDICKATWGHNSWKRYRQHQYVVKRPKTVKKKVKRGVFDTPMVEMRRHPFWMWGCRLSGGGRQWLFPFRVRFKYIKNKTA